MFNKVKETVRSLGATGTVISLVLGLALGFLVLEAYAQIRTGTMWQEYLYYSTTANIPGNPPPGRVTVVIDAGSIPEMSIYDPTTDTRNEVPTVDTAETISGTWTFTGSQVVGSNEDDTITINSPSIRAVLREDFENVASAYLTFNDKVVASYAVTDAAHNLIVLPGSEIPYILFRYEQAMAGTCDPLDAGTLTLASCVDDATNDGILLYFNTAQIPDGTLPLMADFDETDAVSKYCEIQIDIANISAVDDFWFGWVLDDAIDAEPASADLDTAAVFTLVDNAGDFSAVTMLNGGAETADDLGTDWTDGDQFILRVTALADTVVFSGCLTDACTTVADFTTATAVLNIDTDDHMICSLGYTAAAAEELGAVIEYIEIGEAQ